MILRLLLSLTLLLLWNCLVLWRRRRLVLSLRLLSLPLLLQRNCLVLLLQRRYMTLWLLRCLALLLLRRCLVLRRGCRGLLLARFGLIAGHHSSGRPDIAIRSQRLADSQVGRAAMIDAGKLRPIGAGNMLILDLRTHRRRMSLVASRQFGRPGAHLQPTGSAREADPGAAAIPFIH